MQYVFRLSADRKEYSQRTPSSSFIRLIRSAISADASRSSANRRSIRKIGIVIPPLSILYHTGAATSSTPKRECKYSPPEARGEDAQLRNGAPMSHSHSWWPAALITCDKGRDWAPDAVSRGSSLPGSSLALARLGGHGSRPSWLRRS